MPQDSLFDPPDQGIRLTLTTVPTTDGEPITAIATAIRGADGSWRMVDNLAVKGVMHDYIGTVAEEIVNTYQWGSRRDLFLQFRSIRKRLRQHYKAHMPDQARRADEPTRVSVQPYPPY